MFPSAPPPRRAAPRAAGAVTAVVAALLCSSCVLTETKDYVVQPAPPNGLHVTIRHQPTDLLKLVSDLVRHGAPIDAALRSNGHHVRCDHYPNTRTYGDRCAFSVLRSTKLSGSLAARAASSLFWRSAVAANELGDFSRDGMAKVRAHRRSCLHVTIRPGARATDANWTWRSDRDRAC